MTKVEKLERQIRDIKLEIVKIQNRCAHKGAAKTFKADTDADGDNYYTIYDCPVCNKRWTETKFI